MILDATRPSDELSSSDVKPSAGGSRRGCAPSRARARVMRPPGSSAPSAASPAKCCGGRCSARARWTRAALGDGLRTAALQLQRPAKRRSQRSQASVGAPYCLGLVRPLQVVLAVAVRSWRHARAARELRAAQVRDLVAIPTAAANTPARVCLSETLALSTAETLPERRCPSLLHRLRREPSWPH
jgi:hypothetical protein